MLESDPLESPLARLKPCLAKGADSLFNFFVIEAGGPPIKHSLPNELVGANNPAKGVDTKLQKRLAFATVHRLAMLLHYLIFMSVRSDKCFGRSKS